MAENFNYAKKYNMINNKKKLYVYIYSIYSIYTFLNIDFMLTLS